MSQEEQRECGFGGSNRSRSVGEHVQLVDFLLSGGWTGRESRQLGSLPEPQKQRLEQTEPVWPGRHDCHRI